MLSQTIIEVALRCADIETDVSKVESLGEGENNDSYLLTLGTDQKLVLRVSKGLGGDHLLDDEAKALSILGIPGAPRLVFFDGSHIAAVSGYSKPILKVSLSKIDYP